MHVRMLGSCYWRFFVDNFPQNKSIMAEEGGGVEHEVAFATLPSLQFEEVTRDGVVMSRRDARRGKEEEGIRSRFLGRKKKTK